MRPGPALAAAALGWFILGAVGFFSDFVSIIWLLAGLSLLPVIVADALMLFFLADRLQVKRAVSSSLAQDESAAATLEIRRDGRDFLPFRIAVWDLHPPSMETDAFPAVLNRRPLTRRAGEGPLFFEYTLLPRERGQWLFRGTELLLSSPFRFWRLKVFHPCESSGRTYPNFKKIKAAAGADLRGLLERSGLKNIRMRGQGMEFRSLREYQEGDSIRAIDWRATSRRRKVVVREYQEEQDQQVLFLLDSGYRLHRLEGESGGRLQFDSALEAVLLLSWVSLKHGDSAAVGTFGSSKRWLGPRKGISSFPVLMNGLYDLSSAPVPSSPFSALEDALARLKRRTFIVLISNFREEDGESLSWILRQIERRHLLLLVSLREKESEALASRRSAGPEEALESAAAFSYLSSRRELYASWEHSGLLTMECGAGELSSALINRYLQVKRSGRL
ncbi:MAG: DUF58 domain-containing protein [Treponema sp.]|nr:DUF58 domain-containing protein [Treponema sp.]